MLFSGKRSRPLAQPCDAIATARLGFIELRIGVLYERIHIVARPVLGDADPLASNAVFADRKLIPFKLPIDVPSFPCSLIWHRRMGADPGCTWPREMAVKASKNLPSIRSSL